MIPRRQQPTDIQVAHVATMLLLVLGSAFPVSDAAVSLIERQPWPAGVIPYAIDDAIAPLNKQMILDAMAQWESNTCVRFQPATQADRLNAFVDIRPSSNPLECVTPVGYVKETRPVLLGAQCFANNRSIIHELGHVIGLDHEHQHPDRDSQLRILTANIQLQMLPFFDVFAKGTVNTYSLPYDPLSIMHYPSNAFSTSPMLSTMMHHDRAVNALMGFTNHPSSLSDIPAVRQLYRCPQVGGLPDYGIECKDYDTNCGRVPGICAISRNWAESTCLASCGVCNIGEIIVPSPRDADVLKANCSEATFCASTVDVCLGPYAAWARVNCPCKCTKVPNSACITTADVIVTLLSLALARLLFSGNRI